MLHIQFMMAKMKQYLIILHYGFPYEDNIIEKAKSELSYLAVSSNGRLKRYILFKAPHLSSRRITFPKIQQATEKKYQRR